MINEDFICINNAKTKFDLKTNLGVSRIIQFLGEILNRYLIYKTLE